MRWRHNVFGSSLRHIVFWSSLLLLSFSFGGSWHKWEMKEAERLQGQGMSAAALDVFQSLLSHVPAVSKGEQSKLWSHMGECYYALQEPGEAFSAYHRALELNPNNYSARLKLGEFYLAGGAAEQAGEEAKKVLASGGPSAEAFELLGTAAAADENESVAMGALRQALQLDPTRMKAAVLLAQLLDRAEQVEEAQEVLKRAAQAQPGSAAPYLALGRLAEENGHSQEAEQAYRKAVETENTVETKLQLARFLERSARLEEAQKILADVDVARPESPPVLGDFELLAGEPLLAGHNYAGHLRGWLWAGCGREHEEAIPRAIDLAADRGRHTGFSAQRSLAGAAADEVGTRASG